MRRFKVRLEEDSINNLIKELEAYKSDLTRKAMIITDKLAEIGIAVAKTNVVDIDGLGNMTYFITFSKQLQYKEYGCNTIIYAIDSVPLVRRWLVKENGVEVERSAVVSPIYMAEFGAGIPAIDGWQGTFPTESNKGNAFKPGWYYKTIDGVWHYSSGIRPTLPMHKAMIEIQQQTKRICREVLRS